MKLNAVLICLVALCAASTLSVAVSSQADPSTTSGENVPVSQLENETISVSQDLTSETNGSTFSLGVLLDTVAVSSSNVSAALLQVDSSKETSKPAGDSGRRETSETDAEIIELTVEVPLSSQESSLASNASKPSAQPPGSDLLGSGAQDGPNPDIVDVFLEGISSDVGDTVPNETASDGDVPPYSDRQVRDSNSEKDFVGAEQRLPQVEASQPAPRVLPDSSSGDQPRGSSAGEFLAVAPPDYEYYDEPFPFENPSQPGFYADLSLRKCHCKAQEVWDNSSCSVHGGTFVAVLDNNFSPTAVNTSWFGKFDVSPLECEKGYIKSKFPGGSFNLLPTIDLLHSFSNSIFTPRHFCVDHILDAKKDLSWQAEVCVPPPSVPRCCKPGEKIYSLNRHCVSDPTVQFNPPVMLQNTNFSTIDGPVTKVECGEDKEVHWVELGMRSALEYSGQGTFFTYEPEGSAPVIQYAPKYCVAVQKHSEYEDNIYWASFCFKDSLKEHKKICANGTCVRKCCDKDQLFDVSINSCAVPVEGFNLWQPTFHDLNSTNHAIEVQRPKDLLYVYGKPLCKDFFVLEPSRASDDRFFILKNGSLHVPVWDEPVNATSYCVDHFLDDDDVVRQQAMVCFPETVAAKTTCQRVSNIVYPSLLIVSCVFLAITLVVYAAVPELHAKVHGKSLVSHVTALLVSYVGLVVVQWGSYRLPMRACVTMAAIIHISFLATFFWLNVMCFDIYWTLRSLRPIPESGEGSRSRFKWYSIYAWGCPVVVGIVTISMLQLDPEQHPDLILPGFGVKNCWFAEQSALWLYFYGFVLALTIINIFFFLQVAHILFQAHRATRTILRTTTRQEKDRMRLYAKLFVVMGVTWICEVISWQEGTCEVWMFTDIINALQGFFIFLIFVCKRNVFQKLRLKCDPGISRVKRIVRTSSSYVNTSQMSQRTTQITLDSLRRSSFTHPPSAVKLSNGSYGSGMHVIHEDSPVVDSAKASELSQSQATESEFVNGGGGAGVGVGVSSPPPTKSPPISPVFIVGPVAAVDPNQSPTFIVGSKQPREADSQFPQDGGPASPVSSQQNDGDGIRGPQPVTVDVTVHGNVRHE